MRSARLILALLASPLGPFAAMAQEPPAFTLEQRMQLRCSAAFALVAARQAEGDAAMRRYPGLGASGREYFVRSAAAVMAETGLDRAAIDAALRREAQDLVASGTLADIMPACLQALADSRF